MSSSERIISCEPYTGSEELIYSLRDLIKIDYEDLFFGVFVHGSVATGEVLTYSDFDGLLIVKDKFRSSRKLEGFLRDSMRLIYSFDPLQHHGWFLMYESQLKEYPQACFPYELFNSSRTISPSYGISFSIFMPENIDYKGPLFDMIEALDMKVKNHFVPRNMYQAKAFLSQIMLLPVLYIQALKRHGLNKKDSFKIFEKMVTENEYYVIERASYIRESWPLKLNAFQKFCLLRTHGKVRKLIVRYSLPGPAMQAELIKQLDEKFYNSLHLLLESLKKDDLPPK